MPNGRAATCGTSGAPASVARSDSSMSSRHRSGAASTCSSAYDTGMPTSAANRAIQSTSFFGATMSSPAAPSGASSNTARPPAAIARPSPNSSSSAANVPGTGSPSIARWPSVRDVENPSAPASIASCTSPRHGRDVVGSGGLVLRAPLAHAVRAQRAVRDLRADVDGQVAAVERVEVLRERLPAPVHPLRQRGAGDVLHALHQADEPLLRARAHRREAHAAVAGDDGGHAVPRRRLDDRVPRDLAVVVRVHVDEAGRDDRARSRRPSPPRRHRVRRARPRR